MEKSLRAPSSSKTVNGDPSSFAEKIVLDKLLSAPVIAAAIGLAIKGAGNGDECKTYFHNLTDQRLQLKSYNRDDCACLVAHTKTIIEPGQKDYIQALDGMFFAARRCTSFQVSVCNDDGRCLWSPSVKDGLEYKVGGEGMDGERGATVVGGLRGREGSGFVQHGGSDGAGGESAGSVVVSGVPRVVEKMLGRWTPVFVSKKRVTEKRRENGDSGDGAVVKK